ncbi:hypothetical protein RND71_007847 [Anisodus tanguticus]|uniref:Aquaporin NIP7-1 n=1 Tax=Anisodus tanguticus TaxID=243964 RepID=A0AAE1SJQ9_9SOLA|nr:hypothetical protein RND71_007847 [Anisodus tanguticus]
MISEPWWFNKPFNFEENNKKKTTTEATPENPAIGDVTPSQEHQAHQLLPQLPQQQPTPQHLTLLIVTEVLAEALGTFLLMFSICGMMASMEIMGVKVGLMEYTATAALTVVVVVFLIGPISGAHINPAVTLAFAAVGHFPMVQVAQVGGSILATYKGKLVYGLKAEFVTTKPLHGCTSAFLVELLATFIVLFLTASLTNDPQSTYFRRINEPARSLGPAIVAWKFSNLWIYVVAPIIGAVAGVVFYRLLRLQGWSCKPNSTPMTTHQHTPL